MTDKRAFCKNCNKIYRYTWENSGFICVGIVKKPFRNCDILRTCSRHDAGHIEVVDKTPDEVSAYVTAQSILLQNYFRFFYKRPCTNKCRNENNCTEGAHAHRLCGEKAKS